MLASLPVKKHEVVLEMLILFISTRILCCLCFRYLLRDVKVRLGAKCNPLTVRYLVPREIKKANNAPNYYNFNVILGKLER